MFSDLCCITDLAVVNPICTCLKAAERTKSQSLPTHHSTAQHSAAQHSIAQRSFTMTCLLQLVNLGFTEALELHKVPLVAVRQAFDGVNSTILELLDVSNSNSELL